MEFKVYQKELELQSRGWIPTFHDVTKEVCNIVATSGVKNGTVCVASHHTTCSVMVQETSHDIDKWGIEGTEDRKNSDKNNNRFWITQRLDLYAKWSERLVGAQGIHVLYDATEDGKFENVPEGEDDRYALDSLIYLDNSKAIVGPATVPNDPSKDQFLFWVVQEWVEDASNPEGGYYKDVEPKIELSPGNNFSVLARYAKIEPELDENGDPVLDAHGDPKQIYTVQLRAEYGPLEAPKTTYINWYRNHHDDNGEARLHRDEEKLINAPIDIYTLTEGIPERTGYTFLGWARESEYAANQMGEGNVPIEGAVPTTEVGDKPLYLKWVPATEGENGAGGTAAHYEAQDQYDEWVPVTQVAADEVTPYQAFYAIWEKIPTFKVIYASDVMNGTITDDKIYEFCVDDFCSEDDPDKPYLDVVNGVPSAETIKGETGKLIDVYTDWLYGGYRFATIGEDGAVTLGSYAYADEDDPGNKIIPEADMVYYVKNVDPGYLADYYKFTYIKKTKTITGLWFMSILDDLNYLDTGFVIWDKMYQDADGSETSADYYDQRQVLKVWSSLTVNSYDPFGNKTSSIKVSPSTVYNGNGAAPRLTYIGIEDIYDAETFVNTIRTDGTKANFTIVPYWVAFDGIAVVGKNSRTITVHPNANDPAIRTDSALNADFEEWQEIVSTESEGSGGD